MNVYSSDPYARPPSWGEKPLPSPTAAPYHPKASISSVTTASSSILSPREDSSAALRMTRPPSSGSARASSSVRYSKPLSARTRASLDALRRISEVRINHVVKHEAGFAYVLEIMVAGKDSRPRIFHVARTFKEFKKLQHAVGHWCEQHDPQQGPCPYCFQFTSPFARQLWPGAVTRMLMPMSKMQLILAARINDYVRQARGDHRDRSPCCAAFGHVPAIIAGFLLKDQDLATL